MPKETYATTCKTMETARDCLDLCRFSYKMYAQTCRFPMDPFFESYGMNTCFTDARDRVIASVHKKLGTDKDSPKLDSILYFGARTPNPHKGVIYRPGVNDKYVLLCPSKWDKKISHAHAFRRNGNPSDRPELHLPGSGARCGYFRGETGAVPNQQAGWPSFLGAVIHDPEDNTVYIVFRGSRSGNGMRAAAGAQFKNCGSPDWVTDMNYLKELTVAKFGGASMTSGFFSAYDSCKKSLFTAYHYALNGQPPSRVVFTGHSLGGALAQCAYLDFTMGEYNGLVFKETPILCFPMSAPPVALGNPSQHILGYYGGASNIHHFYCPTDIVHGGSTMINKYSSGAGVMGKITGVKHLFDHNPHHIGSETALPSCKKVFEGSHELPSVWAGLRDIAVPATNDPIPNPVDFWTEFKLDVMANAPHIEWVAHKPEGAEEALREAFLHSAPTVECLTIADCWRDVITDSKRKEGLKLALEDGQKYLPPRSIKGESGPDEHAEPTLAQLDKLEELRVHLVKYAKAHKDEGNKATTSVLYTLLIGVCANLTARHRIN